MRTIRILIKSTVLAFGTIAFGVALAAGSGAEVCRAKSFMGLDRKVEAIEKLVGGTTTRVEEIKLYVGWENGKPYMQSNFRSEDPDAPKTYSEYPTKLLSREIKDIRVALLNVIFWGELPADSAQIVEQAMKSATVFVDEKLIKPNGELGFDFSGAEKVKIVSNDTVLRTGEIKLLRLKKPPPAITEVLRGCCLRGRPPGKGEVILANLRKRSFDATNFRFLPFLGGSGTHAVIKELPTLSAAAERTTTTDQSWEQQLDQALAVSKGKSLIVMSHIEGNELAVRLEGKVAFSISVGSLRERARAANVDLILIGCDTAASINDATQGWGVAGNVKSTDVAKRLEEAVQSSSNVAELTERLASEEIELVAYDEQGGHGYAGASAFAKVDGSDFFARVFRILALKKGP
jgi:hypothetical protein